jgi:23S rRNA (adenine2503-C2)-methyltransferase
MYKRFDSSEGNVWKYVFDFDNAIAEAVLYKYNSFEERTVICCSVQSGCPVGCVFCGTGNQFIRNLSAEEIVLQIQSILKDMDIEEINSRSLKFQIMFMSMGEPFLNIDNVIEAIKTLNQLYPNADLLVSTVGVDNIKAWNKFMNLSMVIKKVGLQFSLHSGWEFKRDKIIPYKNKLSIRQMRDVGLMWHSATKRPVFLNYCVDNDNLERMERERIFDLFPMLVFNFTFSVICSPDENMKDAGCRNYERLKEVEAEFLSNGYNVRIFDPAGQDDIGGGCGQLWYTQDWIKKFKEN